MDFGDAMKAVLNGEKVKRKVWGGYWFLPNKQLPVLYTENVPGLLFNQTIMNPMIIAKQKNNRGYSPAIPYPDDMVAEDWEVIK